MSSVEHENVKVQNQLAQIEMSEMSSKIAKCLKDINPNEILSIIHHGNLL